GRSRGPSGWRSRSSSIEIGRRYDRADDVMIYPEPRFLSGGDRYVLIEFGNEMNLELNFIAQGLATAIADAATRGIIETAPCFASILVHYEPDEVPYHDLVKELTRLIGSLGPSEA